MLLIRLRLLQLTTKCACSERTLAFAEKFISEIQFKLSRDARTLFRRTLMCIYEANLYCFQCFFFPSTKRLFRLTVSFCRVFFFFVRDFRFESHTELHVTVISMYERMVLLIVVDLVQLQYSIWPFTFIRILVDSDFKKKKTTTNQSNKLANRIILLEKRERERLHDEFFIFKCVLLEYFYRFAVSYRSVRWKCV